MFIRPDGPISGALYDAFNAAIGGLPGSLEAIGIPFDEHYVPLTFITMPFVASTYIVAGFDS